jgi:hypothetical protein
MAASQFNARALRVVDILVQQALVAIAKSLAT